MRITHTRHRDPQRAAALSQCTLCGGELYAGSGAWRINGQILCQDCLLLWLLGELAPFYQTYGEVRQ